LLEDLGHPRISIIPQADMFMNSLALRKGCYKIIIGPPGGNNVFFESQKFFVMNVDGEENKKNSLFVTNLNNYLYKYGLNGAISAIDIATKLKVFPVNTDMFYKCGVNTIIDILIDWIADTKYNTMSASNKYIK